MAEYIEREALKKEISKLEVAGPFTTSFKNVTLKIISEQPAADVAEVRHGEWIDDGDCYHCSCCNTVYGFVGVQTIGDIIKHRNYCSYCGAKMDK